MVISELDFCESITESTSAQLENRESIFITNTVIGGSDSSVAAYINVLAGAIGKYTKTYTATGSYALILQNGGTVAIALGGGLAIGYTPPSH